MTDTIKDLTATMKSSSIEEKSKYVPNDSITDYSEPYVHVLWASPHTIPIGQYEVPFIPSSACMNSKLVRDLYVTALEKGTNLDLNHLYKHTITNLKVFTHFWNWMNGASTHIEHPSFTIVDYIDFIGLIGHFNACGNDLNNCKMNMDIVMHRLIDACPKTEGTEEIKKHAPKIRFLINMLNCLIKSEELIPKYWLESLNERCQDKLREDGLGSMFLSAAPRKLPPKTIDDMNS